MLGVECRGSGLSAACTVSCNAASERRQRAVGGIHGHLADSRTSPPVRSAVAAASSAGQLTAGNARAFHSASMRGLTLRRSGLPGLSGLKPASWQSPRRGGCRIFQPGLRFGTERGRPAGRDVSKRCPFEVHRKEPSVSGHCRQGQEHIVRQAPQRRVTGESADRHDGVGACPGPPWLHDPGLPGRMVRLTGPQSR